MVAELWAMFLVSMDTCRLVSMATEDFVYSPQRMTPPNSGMTRLVWR